MGKKISELTNRQQLSGNEDLPFQEGQDNGSFTISSLNEFISNSNVNQAVNKIKQAEQQALSNFSSSRVSPEMLSESTKQFINASGGGTINNLADDEDLVSVDKGENLSVLKFADRPFSPDRFSGKGYKILRRNIVGGKNILTQEMINQSDTIYKIRYDFDLDSTQITIPENCILKFDGGSLINGIVNCDNTVIQADPYNIFTNIEIKGVHSSEAYIEWFFRDEDKFYNSAFKEVITYFSTINFISGKEYTFDKSVIDCCHLINPYILFFKKDKTTGQIYKTHILVTKELLRSANGFNNLLVEIPYVGCIGSKWEEFNYVGDDTWTDALGRYIH